MIAVKYLLNRFIPFSNSPFMALLYKLHRNNSQRITGPLPLPDVHTHTQNLSRWKTKICNVSVED